MVGSKHAKFYLNRKMNVRMCVNYLGEFQMNLSKLNGSEKLHICKTYYMFGFLLLPILWIVNAIWFCRELFKAEYPEQRFIKGYVIKSAAGGIIWLIVLTCWIVIFQQKRLSWGEYGDALSIVMPRGKM